MTDESTGTGGTIPIGVTVVLQGSTLSISVNRDPVTVAENANVTLAWNLTQQSTPGASITAVRFETQPGGPYRPWPQQQPQAAGSGWQVNDNNAAGSGRNGRFKYSITATAGGVTETLDPEVNNQPPPGMEGDEGENEGGGQHHPPHHRNP